MFAKIEGILNENLFLPLGVGGGERWGWDFVASKGCRNP